MSVLRVLGGTGVVHHHAGDGHRLHEMKPASLLKLPRSLTQAPNTTSGASQGAMPERAY